MSHFAGRRIVLNKRTGCQKVVVNMNHIQTASFSVKRHRVLRF